MTFGYGRHTSLLWIEKHSYFTVVVIEGKFNFHRIVLWVAHTANLNELLPCSVLCPFKSTHASFSQV